MAGLIVLDEVVGELMSPSARRCQLRYGCKRKRKRSVRCNMNAQESRLAWRDLLGACNPDIAMILAFQMHAEQCHAQRIESLRRDDCKNM